MEFTPRKHLAFRYGIDSQKTLDPQTWNSLPEKIKSVTNSVDLKNSMKNGSVLNACAT